MGHMIQVCFVIMMGGSSEGFPDNPAVCEPSLVFKVLSNVSMEGFAWMEQDHDTRSLGSNASLLSFQHGFDAVVIVIQSFVLTVSSQDSFHVDRNSNIKMNLHLVMLSIYSYFSLYHDIHERSYHHRFQANSLSTSFSWLRSLCEMATNYYIFCRIDANVVH